MGVEREATGRADAEAVFDDDRPKRLGLWLLFGGLGLAMTTLPWTYGDGGNRGTRSESSRAGWISIAAVVLVLAGALMLAARRKRKHRPR